jgi:hypothetical protein
MAAGEVSLRLTKPQARALAECETLIERGLTTFNEVGQALLRIRDERLYRASHKTFEEYCRERWNWSRRHANRQIEAAGVVQNLGPRGPNVNEITEKQARQLAPLLPYEQREVARRAMESFNGKLSRIVASSSWIRCWTGRSPSRRISRIRSTAAAAGVSCARHPVECHGTSHRPPGRALQETAAGNPSGNLDITLGELRQIARERRNSGAE